MESVSSSHEGELRLAKDAVSSSHEGELWLAKDAVSSSHEGELRLAKDAVSSSREGELRCQDASLCSQEWHASSSLFHDNHGQPQHRYHITPPRPPRASW